MKLAHLQSHTTLISMSMQSLKKISQKTFKLEHGNEALMDRQTNVLTFWF